MVENILASAMQASFRQWAGQDPKYKKIWKRFPKESLEIVDIALAEMDVYQPGPFETWWLYEHRRFSKYRGVSVTLAREFMYHFLSAYATNRLGSAAKKKGGLKPGAAPKKTTTQQAKIRQTAGN